MDRKVEKIYTRGGRINLPLFFNKKNSPQNRKIRNSIFLIVVISVITVFAILRAINPIIDALCIDKAKNLATVISNKQATQIMNEYKYEDFVNVVRDSNGDITLIQTNTKNINEVISDIPNKIVEEMEKQSESYISIHLGSVLGNTVFSALGPEIHIKIENVGNVVTKLESEFISEGINQTMHRIYLNIECEATILTPYNTITQKIENQVLIAESVIIGNIPNTYYNIERK